MLMVKSSRFRLNVPEEVPVPPEDEGDTTASAPPAGASKLHRTVQDWEMEVPVRVAVMVALLTPLVRPMPVTVPVSSTETTSGLLLLQVT